MYSRFGMLGRSALGLLAGVAVSSLWASGCAGSRYSYYQYVLGGSPFFYVGSSAQPTPGETGEESTFFDTSGGGYVDVADRHPCAFGRQPFGGGSTDPRSAAGDAECLAPQSAHQQ